MPKVDPETDQMLSDDPEGDPELAGGEVSGGYPKDMSDTGHHSPVTTDAGAQDEGTAAPSEVQGGNLAGNQGGGGR